MKIGLAGIPGSGKTELAEAIRQHFEKEGSSVVVIDDYVSKIQDETGLAFGFMAAYVGNIHVALGRANLERAAYVNEDDTVITCGTMFETSSYAVQAFEKDYENAANEAQKYDFAQRSEATIRIMACFFIDLVRYNHIFYLTPIEPLENSELVKLDKNLQAAFKAFELFEHTVLDGTGNDKSEICQNRLEKVLEVVNANKSKK